MVVLLMPYGCREHSSALSDSDCCAQPEMRHIRLASNRTFSLKKKKKKNSCKLCVTLWRRSWKERLSGESHGCLA